MGIMGIGNANVERYTFKNPDGTVAGTMTVRKSSGKKTKRLQYKFKKISTQLMAAKTSGGARLVMAKAYSEAANLRRKFRCGEYDDSEVSSALIHAEQMIRIAKKRVKHLEEEESAKKTDGICQAELEGEAENDSPANMEIQDDFELDSKELRALMKEMERALEELEGENGLEELTETMWEDMDLADLELLKKKHRSKELREIMEADMKYLKALFSKLEKEKQTASSGVSLELAGEEVPVPVMEAPVVAEGGSVDESV
ncbi:MAG: hypothetical protein NC412_08455 [Roseburia sp.]|nr:hypothetical protein [Roseburia sp.]MCM1279615.1 hypothetical protein [Robinsoniella sp.]